MRPMKRAVHLDFHTMPGIHDFNREWDPKIFARTLKDAHVKYINVFARCNLGFAYYPTKYGIPYPGMKGDMLGDMITECHAQDIGVTAYINVGLDHEQASRHMGWLRLDKEGRVLRGDLTANFFRTLCYNNPEYLEYHYGMLREVCEYDADGLFFDCMVTEPCYCHHCRTKMLAQGIDPDDEAANKAFQYQTMVDFCKETTRIAGEGKYMLFNGMQYGTVRDCNTHSEVECLPSSWSYDHFYSHAAYARSVYPLVLYMTGRFQANWGDFGGFKNKASLEFDYYDALCNNVGVSVGDHMHPARNLEPGVYKTIGEINEWYLQLEPYVEGAAYAADIGVLLNRGASLGSTHNGLSRMLGELQQPFDIVEEYMDLSKYTLLILPDSIQMTDTLKEKLKAHLDAGGKVLSTGVSGLNEGQTDFALPQWDFQFHGVDHSNASYYHLLNHEDPKVTDMDYCAYSKLGSLFSGGTVLANRIKPYFDRHWDGFHGYFYTPPEGPDGNSAASINAQGNVCHIAFSAFSTYYQYAPYSVKSLISRCIGLLLPNSLLKTRGIPSTARVTLTTKPDYDLLHVRVSHPEPRGAMDIIEEHTTLAAGAQVSVRGDYTAACTLPDKKPIAVKKLDDGYTTVMLPEITGYQMVQLQR